MTTTEPLETESSETVDIPQNDGTVTDGAKAHSLCLQVVNERDQVAYRASKAVQSPDDESIATSQNLVTRC